MSYASMRRSILGGGLAVLGLIALVMFVRRVDTVEIVAVLLFVPVFLAFITQGLPGGAVAGFLAAAAYALLRVGAIDAVGADRFAGLIATRTVGYLAFGILGGWAAQQLEHSLEKLDIYDQVDDDTGLFNARFFLQETDLEMARANRYRTLFSVTVIDIPRQAIDRLGRRRRKSVLADLGHALRDAIRTVDRGVHAEAGENHRVAVICPETGPQGAEIFTTRLRAELTEFLVAKGVPVSADDVAARSYTVPGADHELARLRGEFERIEQDEHPEHAQTA